jgi:hypothetical protein
MLVVMSVSSRIAGPCSILIYSLCLRINELLVHLILMCTVILVDVDNCDKFTNSVYKSGPSDLILIVKIDFY